MFFLFQLRQEELSWIYYKLLLEKRSQPADLLQLHSEGGFEFDSDPRWRVTWIAFQNDHVYTNLNGFCPVELKYLD